MTMFQNLHRSMAPSHTLKIQCDACDHRVTLTHSEAAARCGADATPMDIRRRAKCNVCGAEGRVRVWI
jgi:DNA-directed RNA polymerase subunit RPC12/RpoP